MSDFEKTFVCQVEEMFMRVLFVVMLLFVLVANAWENEHAPAFKMKPAAVEAMPASGLTNFVRRVIRNGFFREVCDEEYLNSPSNFFYEYSWGCVLDLNGDGIKDFVFRIPWMCMGVSGAMSTVHIIVSDGKGGRIENVIEGYYVETNDFVEIAGKPYFRQSTHFEQENDKCSFEKSPYDHWVYQVFAFGKDGIMKLANSEVGWKLPKATIDGDQKFRQVGLTASDLKKIARITRPTSRKYVP